MMVPSPFMPWVPRYWVVIILARPFTAVRAMSVVAKMVAGDSELSGATSRYSFEQETVNRAEIAMQALRI